MKTSKILFAILALAAILRFWALGSIPPHLTPDEASLGYNAYSVLKTGKDEYGKTLPIIFKSFGDYKPGLYIYLTVPFVATLGLNEFSVRLPSALVGVFSVLLIYLISRKLFEKEKLALSISFVAAINPWLIHFSRGAWEANVSLTLALAGIYFFLRALDKPKNLILSAAFFGLTALAYQGAKLSSGVVILILLILFFKKLFALEKKILVVSVTAALIITLPIVQSFFTGETGRLEVFSIFSYPRKEDSLTTFLTQGGEKIGDTTYYLFHPEALNFKRAILGRWFNHFSGRFLFFEGDWQNPRHAAPNHGVLLISDMVLLVLGIISLLKLGLKKETAFVWLWLILAPLPAILSRDLVHGVRALNLAVPLCIILGFGLESLLSAKKLVRYGFAAVFLASFVYFLDAYFVHIPKHASKYWEYGYKQIVEKVSPIQSNYKEVYIQQSYAQPYIYFLFFQKYDPAKYQRVAKLTESQYKGDVGLVERLDNICFCAIDWPAQRGKGNSLFVADTIAIPPSDSDNLELFKEIAEIKYLNGLDTAFRIVEVK